MTLIQPIPGGAGGGAPVEITNDVGNPIPVVSPTFTVSETVIPVSTVNVTLLPANPNRKGAFLWNDGSQTCLIKFGSTASATSFTLKIFSQTLYNLEKGYLGQIDGIWILSGGCCMRITELV